MNYLLAMTTKHIAQILQNIEKATQNFDGIASHQPVLELFTE